MHERKREPLARFNAFVRGVLLTCALVVGGLLVVWLAVRSQVNDEIRREVEQRFAQRYREFRVSVRHARMFQGRGVEIHGLSIARRADNRPLAYVDEVFAECEFDAESLLAGERPATEHVYLSGLKLWVERREDGSWDIQRLWPLPEFGSSKAPVTVRDGTVEVTDPRGGVRRTLNLRNMCLEIASPRQAVQPARARASRVPPPMRISVLLPQPEASVMPMPNSSQPERGVSPGSWRKVSKVEKNTGGRSDEDQESQRSDGAP